MKRRLFIALVLSLVFCIACASAAVDPLAYVKSKGFSPEITDDNKYAYSCDYRIATSVKAKVIWTDTEHMYTVTGTWDDMSQLYVDLLDMGVWISCRYIVGNRPRITYNARAKHVFEPISNYINRMEEILDRRPGETPTPAPTVNPTPKPKKEPEPAWEEEKQDYVLNKKSNIFHHPWCSAAKKIKKKNRKDIYATRDEMIAKNYKPCEICNP